MPRPFRLTRSEYARVLKLRPRRISGRYTTLSIYTLPPDMKGPKYGSVVPKKVLPRAVDRNTVERRFREVMRPVLGTIPPQAALVLLPKREALAASVSDLREDVRGLFERAGFRDTMLV